MRRFSAVLAIALLATIVPSTLAREAPEAGISAPVEPVTPVFTPGSTTTAGSSFGHIGGELRPNRVVNSECKDVSGITACYYKEGSECMSWACYNGGLNP